MLFAFMTNRRLQWFCTLMFVLGPSPFFIIPGINLQRSRDSQIAFERILNLKFFVAQFFCVAALLIIMGMVGCYPQQAISQGSQTALDIDTMTQRQTMSPKATYEPMPDSK